MTIVLFAWKKGAIETALKWEHSYYYQVQTYVQARSQGGSMGASAPPFLNQENLKVFEPVLEFLPFKICLQIYVLAYICSAFAACGAIFGVS